MFWKRKPIIVNTGLGPIASPPVPPRPQFVEMFEILQDAEKYDSQGKTDTRNVLLSRLVDCVQDYKNEE